MVLSTASPAAQARGLPPKVEPCWPAPNTCGCCASGQAGPNRHAIAQAFGRGDHVRLQVHALVGKVGAGAAVARLHLVEHEQPVVLGSKFAGRPEILGIQRIDAAFTLYGLRQESDHVGIVGAIWLSASISLRGARMKPATSGSKPA